MLFHYHQRNVNNLIPKLKINSTAIDRVKTFNFLGITVDENMSWNAHRHKVACKIAKVVGTMKRLKHFLPAFILKMLYTSLILPHLTYGIILWGKKLERINKLQKWAIRTITCAKYNAHTDPLFKRLKLLKVHDLQRLAAVKIFHKYKNNTLPKYFDNIFDNHIPNHSYDTRHRQRRRTKPNSITASQSPKYTIPSIVDTLPEHINTKYENHSIQCISNLAKTDMISVYNETCLNTNCYVCNSD